MPSVTGFPIAEEPAALDGTNIGGPNMGWKVLTWLGLVLEAKK